VAYFGKKSIEIIFIRDVSTSPKVHSLIDWIENLDTF